MLWAVITGLCRFIVTLQKNKSYAKSTIIISDWMHGILLC